MSNYRVTFPLGTSKNFPYTPPFKIAHKFTPIYFIKWGVQKYPPPPPMKIARWEMLILFGKFEK